jgi:pimeloyl-ACP methyl ester carboxylesterase
MTTITDLVPPAARLLDIHVTSGRLSASSFGDARAPLLLCVPGLTANQRCYDVIAERIGDTRRHVVALDLRGRGHSDVTPPGTYGWEAHAVDVLEAASALGAERFDLVGHSMGAFVAMNVARLSPQRLRSATLVDAAGMPEASSVGPIVAGTERLGVIRPSMDAYIDTVRGLGAIEPWSDVWERYFAWELTECDGGVISTTSREAVAEDMAYGATHRPQDLWPALTMPALLIRAARPVVPGGGFIVSAADYARFLAEVPGARGSEVDANHYGVIVHQDTAAAIEDFLA